MRLSLMIWRELGVRPKRRALVVPLLRFIPFFRKYVIVDIQKLTIDSVPLMDPRLILLVYGLNAKTEKSFSVLEFGSGHSTIWFSKARSGLTSVEHNPTWYRVVRRSLEQRPNTKCNLLLEEVSVGPSLPGAVAWGKSMEHLWIDYLHAPFKIFGPKKKWDLVISDGMARKQVLQKYFSSLSDNGVLLFHDADIEDIGSLHPPNDKLGANLFYISNTGSGQNIFRGSTFTLFFKSKSSRDLAWEQLLDLQSVYGPKFGPLGNTRLGILNPVK